MDGLLKKDMVEGDEAVQRFDALVGKALSVSNEELKRREEKHKATTHLGARSGDQSLS